jgi:hypothetical protein
MFYLFYKFIKESALLTNNIFSYYLSNIVVLTFLQFAFFILFYNLLKRSKNKLKDFAKKYSAQNNSEVIKNILLGYHLEQINFITKLFNNQLVLQLFSDITLNNKDKDTKTNADTNTDTKTNADTDTKTNADTKANVNADTDTNTKANGDTMNTTEILNPDIKIPSKLLNFFQKFYTKNERVNEPKTKIIYPKLPQSPKENNN